MGVRMGEGTSRTINQEAPTDDRSKGKSLDALKWEWSEWVREFFGEGGGENDELATVGGLGCGRHERFSAGAHPASRRLPEGLGQAHRRDVLAIRLQVEAMRDRVEGAMLDRADGLLGDVHLATHGVGRLKDAAVVALPKGVHVEGHSGGWKAVTAVKNVFVLEHGLSHRIGRR